MSSGNLGSEKVQMHTAARLSISPGIKLTRHIAVVVVSKVSSVHKSTLKARVGES